MDAFCVQCGEKLAEDDRFCGGCGNPRAELEPEASAEPEPEAAADPAPEPEPEPAAATVAQAAPAAAVPTAFDLAAALSREWRTGTILRGYPAALWLVIALYAAAGTLIVVQTLRALPDAIDLFSIEFFGKRFAVVILLLLVLVGLVGVGLLAVALLLHRASRVGRGLAYVVAATVAAYVLLADERTTSDVLALVAAVGAACVLGLAPAVKNVFTGAGAPDADQPTSIVIARVCVGVLLAVSLVLAPIYFILGTVEGKFHAYGAIAVAIAYGAYSVSTRLTRPDRQARVVATAGAGVFVVLELLAADGTPTPLGLGFAAAIPIFLWLPPDARTFYGDPPLRVGATGS